MVVDAKEPFDIFPLDAVAQLQRIENKSFKWIPIQRYLGTLMEGFVQKSEKIRD
jgi:hypothetical protein